MRAAWTISEQQLVGRYHQPIFFAFVLPAVLIAVICSFWSPTWETNDDVAMSMIAHGYGAVAYPSPNLVFSNVLWGYFVQSIPTLNGIVGYSTATMATLLIAHSAILYGMLLLGCGRLASGLVVGLALVRAMLFPQFTMNAGLLAIGGIVLLMAYGRHSERPVLLICAVFLMATAFLVRWLELAFVVLVALPLLTLHPVPKRAALLAACALLLVCVAATLIDDAAYDGAEWQAFKAFNPIRIAFTDFGLDAYFKGQPDLLARHGLSENDLHLLASFFLADPAIADPTVLSPMLGDLPRFPDPAAAFQRAFQSVSVLLHPKLVCITIAAALLTLLNPTRAVVLSWLVFIASMMMLAALGRPGVTRIFYAPLILLVIAAISNWGTADRRREAGIAVVLLCGIAGAAIATMEGSQKLKQIKTVAESMKRLPEGPMVAWGGSFPFETAYPVLQRPPTQTYFALGTFSMAPYSTLSEADRNDSGLLHLLQSGQSVAFVAGQKKIDLLAEYIRTRLKLIPVIERQGGIPRIPLFTVRLKNPRG